MNDIDIEDLIPHRGRMKLVEEILAVDAKSAETAATVNENWPTYKDGAVNALVLIELVAQSAGVCVGWDELTRLGKKVAGKGWIVGIKKTSFSIDSIPLHTRIVTKMWERLADRDYAEIEGYSTIGDEKVSRVILQVFRTDMDFDFSSMEKNDD